MMSKRALRSIGRVLLSLLIAVPGLGAAGSGTREAMADAMARMMDAMGLLDSGPTGNRGAGGPFGSSGWAPGFGMPWGSPFQDPSRVFSMGDMMKQFPPHMPMPGATGGGWPMPWAPSRLEGVWEGRNGELLIVQGDRFRIYAPDVQRMDGLIRISEDRLALYNPMDEQARPFEYAESEGRLAMRDATGEIYIYRRLRLDGLAPHLSPPVEPER